MTRAATTSGTSHSIVPETINARMPVKCISAMPAPITAPPAAAVSRVRRVHSAKPAVTTTAASSNEAIVRAAP